MWEEFKKWSQQTSSITSHETLLDSLIPPWLIQLEDPENNEAQLSVTYKTHRWFSGPVNFKNTSLGKCILLPNEQSVYTYCFNDVKIGIGQKNAHDMMLLLSPLLDSKIEGDLYFLLHMFFELSRFSAMIVILGVYCCTYSFWSLKVIIFS